MEKHIVERQHADRVKGWIETRGGIAIWPSVDLSDLSDSITTPVLNEAGVPHTKPHWKCANKPSRIITDPAEVEVVLAKEVMRFRVGVRRAQFALKVTDGGTRRIRKALDKCGEGSSYFFDYSTQEAVITVPAEKVSLADWSTS